MEHINLSTSLCTPKAVMLEQFQMRRRGGHAGFPPKKTAAGKTAVPAPA